MKFVSVKSPAEIAPEGIDFVFENGNLKQVLLNTDNGQFIVKQGASYSETLVVLKQQEFEEQDRFAVEGTFANHPVKELFEEEYVARERARELERAAPGYSFEVKPLKVKVNDAGEVVSVV